MTTQEDDLAARKAFAAMENSWNEAYADEESENQSLLALEEFDDEGVLALVSMYCP